MQNLSYNKNKKNTHSKYAYVTFMMMNDSFLPGALMFANGIRKQNPCGDIICLVSEGISKKCIKSLKILFDKVITVNEVFINHAHRHQRQDRPYLFSRFNALRLGKDGDLNQKYEKIVLCDADLLPVKNYAKLFEVPAPAGIINENKKNCILSDDEGKYIFSDSVFFSGKWHWHEIYKDFPHGCSIPKQITDRVIYNYDNLGVNASLWVLTPSYKEYLSIMNNLTCPKIQSLVNNLQWPEMQYATIRWSGQWSNIDIRYSGFNGYPCLDCLYGLHYAGVKPWKYKSLKHLKYFFKYHDYCYWYEQYINMMNSNNTLFDNYSLKKLYVDIIETMAAVI